MTVALIVLAVLNLAINTCLLFDWLLCRPYHGPLDRRQLDDLKQAVEHVEKL